MKNVYLKRLNKIEFVLTYACTGKCKHCSEGDHEPCGEHIDASVAADAVRKIAAEYDRPAANGDGEMVDRVGVEGRRNADKTPEVRHLGYYHSECHYVSECSVVLAACEHVAIAVDEIDYSCRN